jgi:hypothetical protein
MPTSLCIVSHDAGGAEILASYVAQQGLACSKVLAGPALRIFQRHFGQVETLGLEEAVASCESFLCGTSWQSDLEWTVLGRAAKAGKRTIAYLEHWVNYPERFVRNGIQHLPDELWVGDADAEILAKAHFPGTPIRLVPNPYLLKTVENIRKLETAGKLRTRGEVNVLFVCENISDHAREQHGDPRWWGYTEVEALEYFFSCLASLEETVNTVTIRPHPSENPEKYLPVADRFRPMARLSSGATLAEEIARADIVAGCESMAMVVALEAGKKVICAIPPGGRSSCLPQSILNKMQLLAQKQIR